MFCTIKFVYYKSFCVRDDIGSYIRTVYHMVSHTPKRQATGSNPAGGARFSVKSPCCKGFCFLPFLVFPRSTLHAFSRLRPLFARGWAAAASNACSPRRFSAIERRALDRSRAAGYHDGITYHFNYGGGNGCAQRIPQAPIFFSANGIGTLLGNIGQHGHGDEGR